jgi:hypothetical protein
MVRRRIVPIVPGIGNPTIWPSTIREGVIELLA